MALIHTVKAFKHLILMFGSNTDISILHAQQNFTGLLCNGHFQAAAGIVVLNGIVTKVVNDLIQQSADTIDNTIIAGNFQRNICYLYVLMIFSATSRLEMRSSMDCFSM